MQTPLFIKKNKLEGFVSDADEWHYHNHQPINHKEYKKNEYKYIKNSTHPNKVIY